jgi:hypothetical protein
VDSARETPDDGFRVLYARIVFACARETEVRRGDKAVFAELAVQVSGAQKFEEIRHKLNITRADGQ